jgi:prepilin-type N-terminal cleavage/methylation domain-containing protein
MQVRQFGSISTPCRFSAFTLVELLVVLAIIGVLVALIVPTISRISAMRAINKTKTELKEVESWIVEYKAKRGYYPPDNPGNPLTNQLYYELSGTVFTNGVYRTLDGSATVDPTMLPGDFGASSTVHGFMNTTKEPRDEGMAVQKFIKELNPGQVAELTSSLRILVGSVGWDTSLSYQPVPKPPAKQAGINPFGYISTNPTHNPESFDLWIDIYVQGKTNRICNWSEDPIKL